MNLGIVPSSFWEIPSTKLSAMWDDEFTSSRGVTVSEDESRVYVEAALPGIDPKDIEVSLDEGTLWIRGETKNIDGEDSKTYYRKASHSFSYRISIPSNVALDIEPDAGSKNGILTVKFAKKPEGKPKKITVKS